MTAFAILCATTLLVQAQDGAPKKHKLTAEQQQVMTSMLAKYDANKDGKLDKTEKAAMSAEDKAAFTKAFPHHAKKKDGDTGSTAPAASTDAAK